jgi:sulfonate transport system ATP-binding protein
MHHLELELEAAAVGALAPPSRWEMRDSVVAKAPFPPAPMRRPRGAAVDARKLSKSYGAREVLREVDLQIAPGEFVAIVGRSGCGKSTLLRLLAGLEADYGGTIEFDTNDDSSARRKQAQGDTRIMFQDARLLPWKRVVDNVALGLAARDARQRALDALAQVGLADRADEWPAVLSGGQRQRVALARALVHTPRLLLLDEPLGALDSLTRIEMQRLIEGLWLRHACTAVLVTHDVAEAIALADRVMLIEDHRIALDQRIELQRPRSRGQATFARHEERILERVLQQSPLVLSDQVSDPDVLAHAMRWAV